MAAMSLSEVVERMKSEGQLTRNSGTNSLKSIKDILSTQTDALTTGFDGLVSAITADALANKELKMENDRLNERLLQALQDLNKGGGGSPSDPSALPVLGAAGLALAGTIGGLLGILKGQFKAIQAFSKLFTLDWVKTKFQAVKISIGQFLDTFKTAVTERIASIRTGITNGINRFKAFFTIADDSPLYKLGQGLRAKIDLLADIFKPIGATISSITTGAATRLTNIWNIIKGYMTTFGERVGSISKTVGRIFAPIAIVITLFDTVKGAIDGYAEGGILGGLEGAIVGFFTSLVTKPLDLVKDAVAWVLGKFGFDEESEALKSFSFTELFTNMVGGLFDFVDKAVDWVKTLFSDPVKALSDLWSGLYGEEGIFNTLLWQPISKGINWIMEKFGWKEEGAPDFDLFTFISDTWKTVVDKVKSGFESFGNFIASIPAKLKLFVLETVAAIPGGGFLVGEDDIAAAQANVAAFDTVPSSGASGTADALEAASGELTATETEKEAASFYTSPTTIGVDAGVKIDQRSDTVYVESDMSAKNGQGWANMDQEAYMRMAASGNFGG